MIELQVSDVRTSAGSFRACIGKFITLLITMSISLVFAFLEGDYRSFFITVLIQAINNVYEGFEFFDGYSAYIVRFQLISVISAVLVFIISVLVVLGIEVFLNVFFVVFVVIALSIPVLFYGVELHRALKNW